MKTSTSSKPYFFTPNTPNPRKGTETCILEQPCCPVLGLRIPLIPARGRKHLVRALFYGYALCDSEYP